MDQKQKAAAASAVVLLIVAMVIYMWPNDKNKIRKQFSTLASTLDKSDKEGAATIALKTQKLGELFGETCRLELSRNYLSNSYSGLELAKLATQMRLGAQKLSVSFSGIKMVITGDEAQVICLVKVKGKGLGGRDVNEARNLECILKKTKGEWRFYQFAEVIPEKKEQ